MVRVKRMKEKGKVKLSVYFQEFKKGDKVSIVREASIPAGFPERMQGRTGEIEGKRGKAYIVKLKDYNQEKRYIVKPIHLKKIK